MSARYPNDWDEIRRNVLGRDGYACVECGVSDDILHVDHIEPISEGGTHDYENLRTLCADCHADRHDTKACEVCGLFAEIQLTEMKDSGSGGAFFICSECFAGLDNKGDCGICGDTDAPVKATLIEQKRDASAWGLCRECRKRTVHRDQYGRVTERLETKGADQSLKTDGGASE